MIPGFPRLARAVKYAPYSVDPRFLADEGKNEGKNKDKNEGKNELKQTRREDANEREKRDEEGDITRWTGNYREGR